MYLIILLSLITTLVSGAERSRLLDYCRVGTALTAFTAGFAVCKLTENATNFDSLALVGSASLNITSIWLLCRMRLHLVDMVELVRQNAPVIGSPVQVDPAPFNQVPFQLPLGATPIGCAHESI